MSEEENLPSVKDLKSFYENLDDAIDATKNTDLGSKHYAKAKKRTLTLKKIKREKNYSDLMKIFEPTQQQQKPQKVEEKDLLQKLLHDLEVGEESTSIDNETTEPKGQDDKQKWKLGVSFDSYYAFESAETFQRKDEGEETWKDDDESDKLAPQHLNSEWSLQEFEPLDEDAIQEEIERLNREEQELWDHLENLFVRSDRDIAEIMYDVIHEYFYNPKTGFWPQYDAVFRPEVFTCLGKPGWDAYEDTPERLLAREPINQKKNKEVERLLRDEFCRKAVRYVLETMRGIVSGVKRTQVKRAIKNHVRDHLKHLIYDDFVI